MRVQTTDGRHARRRGRAAAAAVLLALVAAVSACATIGRAVFEEPVVHFRGLRVNGLGLSGGALDVELSIYNPNRYNLESTRFRYNLLMDSVHVADGTIDTRQTFRGGDSTYVTIPVNFTYAGLGRAGAELLRSGTVNYTVSGDVDVSTPVGNFTLPYRQTRRFTPLGGSGSR